MPNETDQSRIADTLKGGNVVNLDAYRDGATTRKAAMPFLPESTQTNLFFGALILALFLIFFGFLRR